MSNNNFKIKLWFKKRIAEILLGELKNKNISNKNSKIFLSRNILLLAHSLEKGSGIRNTKVGYGIEKAKALASNINDYYANNYNVDAFALLEGIKVLKYYLKLSEAQGTDVESVKEKVRECDTDYLQLEIPEYKAGVEFYSFEELCRASNYQFDEFVQTRHSMRTFSKDSINIRDIRKAIDIANFAPSACNRQPTKVYYLADKDKVTYFSSLISGNRGFENEIPSYLIVTENKQMFEDDELLQWYVNGGIYLSYLTLALSHLNIGSIIMQYKFSNAKDREIRSLLHVPNEEMIVAVVGIGKYPKEGAKCLCAQRKSSEFTLKVVD